MRSCLIIGGGTAGTVSALVLSKLGIKCTIYELRDKPATIGGAVNLTPNALKLLQRLGVEISGCVCEEIEIYSYHTGAWLGELTFRGPSGHALRAVRERILEGLLEVVKKAGVEVFYGSKLSSIEEGADGVVAKFENGTSATADFILGCDGMYSATRMRYVDPERKPIYTGIASAYTIVGATGITSPIHFKSTCLNSGRWGSLLTTYCDPEKTNIYLASVMEAPEQESKEGWRARGNDNEETVKDIKRRYGDAVFPCIPELIEKVDAYTFYPCYKLPANGKWARGRVLLLGDAAHGMPPQGESTGLAIEDATLFAMIVETRPGKSIEELFEIYQKTRRPRINLAYKHATTRWRVYDKSWSMNKFEEWATWAYLWLNTKAFQESVNYDITKEKIVE